METVEHFARISLVARLLGRERLLSREEVERLQGLRGSYGIAAPAPICPPEAPAVEGSDDILGCQVVVAPSSPTARLVDDQPAAWPVSGVSTQLSGKTGEIRLTYRELTALIEDAVKALLGGSHG